MTAATPRTVEQYLDFRSVRPLKGAAPALVQDALYDAEEHLRAELAQHPGDNEGDVLGRIVSTYGAPDEVADAYRANEVTIQAALRTPRPRPRESAVGRFFGVYADPRAYLSLLYMLLALLTGIVYFTFAVTGLWLSVGLAILIIGVPFFLLFVGIARVVALAEGRIVELMLGTRMPRRPMYQIDTPNKKTLRLLIMNTHHQKFSRRNFLWTAAAFTASSAFLRAEDRPATPLPTLGSSDPRSVVSVTNGTSRRKNIHEALVAIEDRIMPVLKTKKCVVIKPNIVSTRNQLGSTHVDALHGILDFLGPRFKGPVVIAESSAGFTTERFDSFGYNAVVSEHKPLEVSLVDRARNFLHQRYGEKAICFFSNAKGVLRAISSCRARVLPAEYVHQDTS